MSLAVQKYTPRGTVGAEIALDPAPPVQKYAPLGAPGCSY
jgi:hypothetical protein